MTDKIRRNLFRVVWGLPLCLTVACSAQTVDGSVPGATQQAGTACPVAGPPPIIGRGLMMLSGAPPIVLASSIARSDSSTSTVITPDPRDQIRCGKSAIKTTSNIVFSTPTLTDGRKKTLKMDVLAPRAAGSRPAVIYIPGGGFMIAIKDSALDLRTYMAEAGFVVASIEYRTTADHASYRDGVADVKSAVRYLRAHSRDLGINPTRIAVWGESAGGYMSAMAAVTNGHKDFDIGDNLDQSSDVQAVIDKFGPSDASKVADDFDPNARKFYADPNNSVARYTSGDAGSAANPLTYIGPSATAFLIFHGSNDRLVSPSQTLILHNALTAAGVHSTRYVINGAGHGDMSFLGDSKAGLPWSTNQVMGIMVGFLNREIATGSGDRK